MFFFLNKMLCIQYIIHQYTVYYLHKYCRSISVSISRVESLILVLMANAVQELTQEMAILDNEIDDIEQNVVALQRLLAKAEKIVLDCKISNTVGNGANIVSTGLLWLPPAWILALGGVILGTVTSLGTGVTEAVLLSQLDSRATRVMGHHAEVMEQVETVLDRILEAIHTFIHATGHVLEYVAHNGKSIAKIGETAALSYNAIKAVKVTETAVVNGSKIGVKSAKLAKVGSSGVKSAITISTKTMFAVGAVFSVADIAMTWKSENSCIAKLKAQIAFCQNDLNRVRSHRNTTANFILRLSNDITS
jgi:hypothetical protein